MAVCYKTHEVNCKCDHVSLDRRLEGGLKPKGSVVLVGAIEDGDAVSVFSVSVSRCPCPIIRVKHYSTIVSLQHIVVLTTCLLIPYYLPCFGITFV